MPLVSICIPTYNGAGYIASSIESAIAQTCRDLEIVVVDDSSHDETVPIVRGYAVQDSRIRVYENDSNLGLVANWNRSVTLAEGEWIKFLHQDDRLEGDCVERMLAASKPGVDLVATRRHLIFTSETTDAVRNTYDQYLSEHDLARHFPGKAHISSTQFSEVLLRAPHGNCIGEPTATMLRRSAFETYGYFNADLVSLCDWEYWARVAVNTGLCYVDQALAYFRVHADSESARLRSAKRFRSLHLDPLLILYEMTYSPYYAPLRVTAASREVSVNLRERLSDAVRASRWEAYAATDGGEARTQWWKAIRRRPRLLAFSPGYLLRFIQKKIGL